MLRNMSFLVSLSHTALFRLHDRENDSWPNTALEGIGDQLVLLETTVVLETEVANQPKMVSGRLALSLER